MASDDEDVCVSGGSGWEDFGTDEAKHALEVYHNRVTLFEDADETSVVSVSSVRTPVRSNRSISAESVASSASSTLAYAKKEDERLEGPICSQESKLMTGVILGVALLGMIVATLILVTDVSSQFHKWKVAHNFEPETEANDNIEHLYLADAAMTPAAVPRRYANLADAREFPSEIDGDAIPLLWDIPGDGDVLQHILSNCLGLVAAGGALGNSKQMHVDKDAPLEVFESAGRRYVNVYIGTEDGIERAKNMNLAESDLVDVIYSPLVYESGSIFTESHKGRMFAMFHHPVHRVYSIYHIVRTIVPDYANKTLEEFLNTPQGANNNNWLTRELAGYVVHGEATEEHFQTAKAVLREKCLVGVTSDMDTSLDRLIRHFGWDGDSAGSDYEECKRQIKETTSLDRLYFDLVEENSSEWNLLAERNQYDVRLHEFVLMLFKEQMSDFDTTKEKQPKATSGATFAQMHGLPLGIVLTIAGLLLLLTGRV